jgi:glycosyltransferase involved in cell wall biosynthesis
VGRGDQKDFVDVTLLGNYPHDENESMVRFAEMLRNLLAARGIQVEILQPEPFFGRLKRGSQGIAKWLGYLDKYIVFPISLRRYIRRKRGNGQGNGEFLIHICDHSNAVYTRWLQDVPHLVTCHDVMAILAAGGHIPGIKVGWTGRVLQSWILSGLKNASFIACDTPETRKDLLMLVPELESRSCTVELPLNYPYAPMPVEKARAKISPLIVNTTFDPAMVRFLFHVGGNQWYKNREGVIRIYAQLCVSHPDMVKNLSLKLVMAGKPPTEEMQRLANAIGPEGSVIFVTSVSNQQLCAFYTEAEALIYPSLKEGFGWPIIEAQACGCPVVTSDRAPMNRLAGPAALLADPENESEFASQVFEILNESFEARKSRKNDALIHSRNFDPEVFVEQILLKYRQVIEKKVVAMR